MALTKLVVEIMGATLLLLFTFQKRLKRFLKFSDFQMDDFIDKLIQLLNIPIRGPITGMHVLLFGLYMVTRMWWRPAFHRWLRGTQIKASHILSKTEKEALEIKQKLQNGETFEELAKELSICPSAKRGGKLAKGNPFGKLKMTKVLDELLFDKNTVVGEIYGPIESEFGFHIIRVDPLISEETTDKDKKTK
jgi:peptidyl-prolyl cis-trans isomerase C